MIESLTLIHLSKESTPTSGLEEKLHSVQNSDGGRVFVLGTCQRTLLFGYGQRPLRTLTQVADTLGLEEDALLSDCDVHQGHSAYRFLLEVLLGLKSQVLGEYEIVGQFRRAYQRFCTLGNVHTPLLGALEKLLKDAKEIRSKHLLNIGQQSYAGITRKLCQSNLSAGSDLLIVGSGELAHEFLRIAVKKFNVTLTARNLERGEHLAQCYGVKFVPLTELSTFALQFKGIVNTVGAENLMLFGPEFFNQWQEVQTSEKLFIDLGAPSSIQTHLASAAGVYRLDDIFKLSEVFGEETRLKIAAAQSAAHELASKRAERHSDQVLPALEELNFA